jgi:hypothetical protein
MCGIEEINIFRFIPLIPNIVKPINKREKEKPKKRKRESS